MTTERSDAAFDALLGMFRDLGDVVREDARDGRERLEGYRVLARIIALCSELSLDVDPEVPRFFSMTTPLRQVGGPNPEGEYDLCALTPGRSYRVRGRRETVTYLGFQVMAGTGLAPRRQAAYLSDTDLTLGADGTFEFVLAPTDPGTGEHWVQIPHDASAVVVRQYISDRRAERIATYEIAQIEPAEPVAALTDETLADQLSAFMWTAFKLMTLHRTVLPELLSEPNRLVTSEAAALGSENTTPDNLYMLGAFDLGAGQALVLDIAPPDTRYWSITLENVWHECLEPVRTRSSGTHASFQPRPDGTVRVVIAADDPGVPNWLDTGGRRRGFIVLRWLDNPDPPDVTVTLTDLAEVTA
ncbi:hypothetical protein MPUL_48480 [Mycolicibacterium pulveris]|uniref:DUF1214 domain-containing protein n=1 Tax=Mycolicibacterium pulveris TaxID=36813 RepID=A0A7I7URM3_MYCPV|nr:DUF1214 domain-containing protein [Mycolicibacterium pulveris]BBY83690.1 hypothetical protein MPUL_48480 [Mycolicibacterium pulveris]